MPFFRLSAERQNFSFGRPLVKMLMEAGAKPDKADKFGKTPLTLAVRNSTRSNKTFKEPEKIKVIKFLLDKGGCE